MGFRRSGGGGGGNSGSFRGGRRRSNNVAGAAAAATLSSKTGVPSTSGYDSSTTYGIDRLKLLKPEERWTRALLGLGLCKQRSDLDSPGCKYYKELLADCPSEKLASLKRYKIPPMHVATAPVDHEERAKGIVQHNPKAACRIAKMLHNECIEDLDEDDDVAWCDFYKLMLKHCPSEKRA